MRIFYSCSFSKKINPSTGRVLPEHLEVAQRDISGLRGLGYEVYCDMEKDDWRIDNSAPEEVVRRVVAEIDLVDILVARLDTDVSAGVQWEIGYAVGRGKKVYIVNDQKMSFWNQGLVDAGLVHSVASLSEIG